MDTRPDAAAAAPATSRHAAGRYETEPVPAPGATMRAVVQDAYGGADVLRLDTVPVPVPTADQILVRVQAASLNAADWHLMQGQPLFMRALGFGVRRPRSRVRGIDAAGHVVAVGSAVTTLRPGDEVWAEAPYDGRGTGTLAEYVVLPEGRASLKPAGLTFEQAAAVPLAACTALQGLRDSGKLQPGQKVLINGASGGVGTFAVQIAKALGAEVTAVCSTRNVELARSLGADHVIDYTREDFTRRHVPGAGGSERYDVVLDLVANRSVRALRRVLRPTGTLVLSGGGGGRWLGPIPLMVRALVVGIFVRQTVRVLSERFSQDDVAVLRALIESGQVTPTIDRVYALAEAPSAMRYLVEEHARAKVVIVV